MAFREGIVMCSKCGFTYWLSVGHECDGDIRITMEKEIKGEENNVGNNTRT